jgi:flagellar L-ring protein precursor FlgH
MDYYVDNAGGYTEEADYGKTVVFLPSGKKWDASAFFFPDPDILPGSSVYVPRKIEKPDTTLPVIRDILTIVVEETNESAKQNNTKTAKKTGISASISSFLFGAGQDGFLTRGGKYPSMDMKSDKSFEGGGTINNSERITARIAVRVTEVLPNGHMMLEGRRMTLVGGEEQQAVLRGLVRQEDIQPGNTVLSHNVADATIKFVSKGVVSDSQRRGWFTRAFDKITPF